MPQAVEKEEHPTWSLSRGRENDAFNTEVPNHPILKMEFLVCLD